jgi:hypothetical protein
MRDNQTMTRQFQRIIVYLCLASVLFAAFAYAGANLPVLLVAVWILFGLAIVPAARPVQSRCPVPFAPILPVFSSRPPPIF